MTEQSEVRGKRRRGCLILLVGFVGIGAVGALIGKLNAPQETELDRAERIRADGDLATLARGQRAIRTMLKDPSTAEFSDGYGRLKHGQHVACGYVNGRNSFGAMAGPTPWLAIAEKNVAMVRSLENQRTFVRTWNEYCTGLDDRDKPMPGEFDGVRLGSRPPSSLVASSDSKAVLIYRGDRPARFLGVPIEDAWFEAEHGRISGISVTARGTQSYEALRDQIRRRYGPPTNIGSSDPPIFTWEWMNRDPRAQLSFNRHTDQALLTLRAHGD
jgi:hypothetical protein